MGNRHIRCRHARRAPHAPHAPHVLDDRHRQKRSRLRLSRLATLGRDVFTRVSSATRKSAVRQAVTDVATEHPSSADNPPNPSAQQTCTYVNKAASPAGYQKLPHLYRAPLRAHHQKASRVNNVPLSAEHQMLSNVTDTHFPAEHYKLAQFSNTTTEHRQLSDCTNLPSPTVPKVPGKVPNPASHQPFNTNPRNPSARPTLSHVNTVHTATARQKLSFVNNASPQIPTRHLGYYRDNDALNQYQQSHHVTHVPASTDDQSYVTNPLLRTAHPQLSSVKKVPSLTERQKLPHVNGAIAPTERPSYVPNDLIPTARQNPSPIDSAPTRPAHQFNSNNSPIPTEQQTSVHNASATTGRHVNNNNNSTQSEQVFTSCAGGRCPRDERRVGTSQLVAASHVSTSSSSSWMTTPSFSSCRAVTSSCRGRPTPRPAPRGSSSHEHGVCLTPARGVGAHAPDVQQFDHRVANMTRRSY